MHVCCYRVDGCPARDSLDGLDVRAGEAGSPPSIRLSRTASSLQTPTVSAMAAAARHLLNPLATPEQIARTPSREDGIAEALETDLRACESSSSSRAFIGDSRTEPAFGTDGTADGALLIQQVGIQLKAPQVLMTTASVLFQRFWYVSSMRSFSVKVRAGREIAVGPSWSGAGRGRKQAPSKTVAAAAALRTCLSQMRNVEMLSKQPT